MKILALDTSTNMASIAVMDENMLLGEYSLNQDLSHSENLLPMIKEILDSLNLKINDIDLYGVSIGPGSFTGLRIGVTTVKAFAHLFDKPIVGVSTLEALGFNLAYNNIVVPMIDARRDRVYTGIYTWENAELVTLMEADALEMDILLEKLDNNYEKIVVNGNGTLLHRERIEKKLGSKVRFASIGDNSSRATSVGELALINYNKGQVDNYYTLAPDYLRKSQAERELDKKEQG